MSTILANKKNYGSKRATSKIKYIVIHYTANDGDTDENNGKYFKNNVVKSSAHYFVDSDSVTQSVPDDYTAWAVGGSRWSNYKTTGGAKYYSKCTNTNSISVELCDDVKNGVIYPSEKTIERAAQLVKSLMKKYNVPLSNVIRHFDVTGKPCPAYWVDNNKWNEFKSRLSGAAVSNVEEYNMDTIKKGSKGKAVKIWQIILGFTGADVDGSFGSKTETATKNWQKNKGLTVDGIVGKNSWKAGLESV